MKAINNFINLISSSVFRFCFNICICIVILIPNMHTLNNETMKFLKWNAEE